MRKSLVTRTGGLMIAALFLMGTAQGQSLQGQETNASCLPELAVAETREHVPAGLLLSMALVESGRRDPITGMVSPWPWAVQAKGQGHFYETANDAVRQTSALLAAGDGFIDVGCLQVDLFHHPDAFRTLEAAFDPTTNIDYAAHYLSTLAHRRGSWLEAVASYNAGDPSHGVTYLAKVLYLWKGVHLTAQAAQIAPDNPQHIGFALQEAPQPLDLAARFFADKDYSAALALYNEQLRHQPDDVTALIGAAETLSAGGHPDDARDRLERALRAAPDDRLVLDELLRLIDALLPERQWAALQSARRAAPAAAEIAERIALSQAASGQADEAALSMAEAIRLAPGDPIRLLDYALLLDGAGSTNAARTAYRNFLDAYRPGRSPALTVSMEKIRARAAYLDTTSP